MMGRTLPSECEHGTTIDWGDFGPCQDCETDHRDDEERCPNFASCSQCDADEAQREHVRWELIGDAIRGFLMEKHVPFYQVDSWADELVSIVREHDGGS